MPDPRKRYARKAIFRKLAYHPYAKAELAFAPNINDGGPGERRPGVAVLSRFGFVEPPQVLQELPETLEIHFPIWVVVMVGLTRLVVFPARF